MKILLPRFAYRHVVFDVKMARSFYRLPEKDLRAEILSAVRDVNFGDTPVRFMGQEI